MDIGGWLRSLSPSLRTRLNNMCLNLPMVVAVPVGEISTPYCLRPQTKPSCTDRKKNCRQDCTYDVTSE